MSNMFLGFSLHATPPLEGNTVKATKETLSIYFILTVQALKHVIHFTLFFFKTNCCLNYRKKEHIAFLYYYTYLQFYSPVQKTANNSN